MFDEADRVLVSVTFTWDRKRGEELAEQWRIVTSDVYVGGPAYGHRSGQFVRGLFLKEGYTITSRGCPNKCWFCSVPKDVVGFDELEIVDGWNVQDDNLLACSERHIRNVFAMLQRQTERVQFQGGLEAKILREWHLPLFKGVKVKQMFFAYDTPDDLKPLQVAGELLREYGFDIQSRVPRCYVLIGYKGDTQEKATKRLHETIDAGFIPCAMLYRDDNGRVLREWKTFQRQWIRPTIVLSLIKKVAK